MTEDTWRPLGLETEEEIAEYDALHDGVPGWMVEALWAWVEGALTVPRRYPDGSGPYSAFDVDLAEQMCQRLKISLPNLRGSMSALTRAGEHDERRRLALQRLRQSGDGLRVADYLLAHEGHASAGDLDGVLERSKSAYTVGTRAGRPGLVRRVPAGVQDAADSVMARAQRAGVRLARAWELLYGLEPNASEAYRQAIVAVEDAAIPVVSPKNKIATLGTVLRDMEQQTDWRLPMDREHANAPTGDVLIGMMRALYHGQHDRHGGQPSAPGDVSIQEATVAVSLAVPLVNLFSSGLVARDLGGASA